MYAGGSTLSFEMASADCGNGVVYGSVPEPGTLALIGAGIALIGTLRRRTWTR